MRDIVRLEIGDVVTTLSPSLLARLIRWARGGKGGSASHAMVVSCGGPIDQAWVIEQTGEGLKERRLLEYHARDIVRVWRPTHVDFPARWFLIDDLRSDLGNGYAHLELLVHALDRLLFPRPEGGAHVGFRRLARILPGTTCMGAIAKAIERRWNERVGSMDPRAAAPDDFERYALEIAGDDPAVRYELVFAERLGPYVAERRAA